VSTGRQLQAFDDSTSTIHSVAFGKDGKWFLYAGTDGSVRIRNTAMKELAASLIPIPNTDDWVVISPNGLFDGTLQATQRLISWRAQGNLVPASQYYDTYYTPGLLAQILSGNHPVPGAQNKNGGKP